jgi:hypothetical protein
MDRFTHEFEVQNFPSFFNSTMKTTAYTADIIDRRGNQDASFGGGGSSNLTTGLNLGKGKFALTCSPSS